MKFIVTTDKYGAPKSLKLINPDGETGFQITGGVVTASTAACDSTPMAISLTLLADEIQFVSEAD